MPDRSSQWCKVLKLQLIEFAAGLFVPSAGATLGAIAFVLALLTVCCALVSPRSIANAAPGYVMAKPEDEYAYLTAEAIRIAHHPPEGLSVVIVGDSAIREAISSEAELAEVISAKAGRPVTVHLLAAGGLNQWCSVQLTDYLRGHVRGLVLVEISANNLASRGLFPQSPALWRLALDSPAFRQEKRLAKIKTRHTGIYLLDHFRFYLARPEIALNLLHGPVELRHHILPNWRVWQDRDWRNNHRKIFAWESGYPQMHDANLAVYGRMMDRLRHSDGITAALIESPCNPRTLTPPYATAKDCDLLAHYSGDVQRFAQEHKVPYWDLNKLAELRPEEFTDYTHVRSPDARRRYMQVLAERAAESLRESGMLGGKS